MSIYHTRVSDGNLPPSFLERGDASEADSWAPARFHRILETRRKTARRPRGRNWSTEDDTRIQRSNGVKREVPEMEIGDG
ncbi:hypothetical protein HPP92_014990 [Vanilla planifolia]|uniref:Uncharacterized protein n=1 Tax=Vanilla planifolia TaxID=51239 RepID=A0A835QR73_VANPL|nr:hypothetical protein HPP92_014990 [Vanilla planifolia]